MVARWRPLQTAACHVTWYAASGGRRDTPVLLRLLMVLLYSKLSD